MRNRRSWLYVQMDKLQLDFYFSVSLQAQNSIYLTTNGTTQV